MNETEFGKAYLANINDIENEIKALKMYDEDLLHDTYIDLYEWSQSNEILDFVNTYVEFFKNRYKWRDKEEDPLVAYDNEHLAALEIIDESQDVEIIDRDIDLLNELRSDEYKEQLRKMLNYYYRHPQPGERNHKQACKVLRYFLDGKSEREISHKFNIAHQTVHQYITRTIERLKTATPLLLYRGPSKAASR